MLDKYIRTKTFSCIYSILLFAISVFIIFVGWDGYDRVWCIVNVNQNMYIGIQVLVLITSAMLILSSRLTDAMLPAMMLVVLSTACYNSADKFTSPSFLWVALFAVPAVVFHFVKYRGTFKIGKSFWGLCAVTVAVTLGGIGHISASDYFGGSSLFYVFGLGAGMIAFYLLVKSQIHSDDAQNIARVMYITGMLAAFSIYWLYISNWSMVEARGKILEPQFGNNLSTIIMMALPFAFYYASKRCFDFASVIVMYVAIVISGSQGGLVMGTIEMVILLIVFSIFYQKGTKGTVNRVIYLGSLLGAVALGWCFLPEIARLAGFVKDSDISRLEIIKQIFNKVATNGQSRLKLLGRMVDDFRSNPIFGVGIGYTGNSDIYSPVKGAMNWYHMWLPQIVGSLGVVGILAYGYQLFARVRIFLKNQSHIFLALFMSYIGLLLMSQLNPGEFCPVPYAALAVTYFAFIEKSEDDIPLVKKEKKEEVTIKE